MSVRALEVGGVAHTAHDQWQAYGNDKRQTTNDNIMASSIMLWRSWTTASYAGWHEKLQEPLHVVTEDQTALFDSPARLYAASMHCRPSYFTLFFFHILFFSVIFSKCHFAGCRFLLHTFNIQRQLVFYCYEQLQQQRRTLSELRGRIVFTVQQANKNHQTKTIRREDDDS